MSWFCDAIERSTSCGPRPRQKQSALRGERRPWGVRTRMSLESVIETQNSYESFELCGFLKQKFCPDNQELYGFNSLNVCLNVRKFILLAQS